MKLKRKILKAKARLSHRRLAISKNQVIKLRKQRDRDLKEAQRYAALAAAKEEAAQAASRKRQAKAPLVAARKKRMANLNKQAKGAMASFVKAFQAIDAYANKGTKKKKKK